MAARDQMGGRETEQQKQSSTVTLSVIGEYQKLLVMTVEGKPSHLLLGISILGASIHRKDLLLRAGLTRGGQDKDFPPLEHRQQETIKTLEQISIKGTLRDSSHNKQDNNQGHNNNNQDNNNNLDNNKALTKVSTPSGLTASLTNL